MTFPFISAPRRQNTFWTVTVLGTFTGTTQTNLSFTTINNAPAGSKIVVVGGWGGGASYSSVTDTLGSTYTLVQTVSGSLQTRTAYTATALGSQLNAGSSISMNLTAASQQECFCTACAVTPIIASGFDTQNSALFSGSSPSITSATLAQASEIVFGHAWGYTTTSFPTWTQPAGWTRISTAQFGIDICGHTFDYITVNSTSAVTYNPTSNVAFAANANIGIVTFKS